MIRLLQITTLLLACCCIFAFAQQKQSLILGVIEDFPDESMGEPNTRALRVLFQKTGNEWKAFPTQCADETCVKTISSQYPNEISWTIAFDGKSLGKLSSRTLKEFRSYAGIGQQEILSGGTVPTIGKKSLEWGGIWDTEVHRPIVVVSQPNFKDPDGWKPVVLSPAAIAGVRVQFRKQYPSLCRIDNVEDNTKRPWRYSDAQVKVTRAYISKGGWSVVGLHLENARDCSDEEAGFQVEDPWFAIKPNGEILFLDTGLTLVDAGDYDNRGASELIFIISRVNGGGFELFYSNFSKRAVFQLNAH